MMNLRMKSVQPLSIDGADYIMFERDMDRQGITGCGHYTFWEDALLGQFHPEVLAPEFSGPFRPDGGSFLLKDGPLIFSYRHSRSNKTMLDGLFFLGVNEGEGVKLLERPYKLATANNMDEYRSLFIDNKFDLGEKAKLHLSVVFGNSGGYEIRTGFKRLAERGFPVAGHNRSFGLIDLVSRVSSLLTSSSG